MLLLDDTTSALDATTEVNVLNNIKRDLSHVIVLAVASRPSVIGMADSVTFINRDEIFGPAQHIELLVQNSAYRELMQAYENPQTKPVSVDEGLR